jgi:hypothetical protein
MLKWLVILAVMTGIFVLTAQTKPTEGTAKYNRARIPYPQPETQHNDEDGQKTPPVIVQVGTQQPNTSEANEEKETQRVADYTFWLMVFTAVLAGVSMGQGYFLSQQTRHLKRHGDELHALASATRNNAENALKQTEHIVTSERAWIWLAGSSFPLARAIGRKEISKYLFSAP